MDGLDEQPKRPVHPTRMMLARALQRARGSLFWERLWPALATLATALALFLAFSWAGLWQILPPLPRAIGLVLFAILTCIAALPFLVRDWRLALATAALCAICAFAGAILALRSGLFVPIAAALETLALAWVACVILAWRARRPHSRNIQHSS